MVEHESDTLKNLVGQIFLLVNYTNALDLHLKVRPLDGKRESPKEKGADQRGFGYTSALVNSLNTLVNTTRKCNENTRRTSGRLLEK